VVLVLDEVQKVPGWSEIVKRLWDEDTRKRRAVMVVILGSAPLLMQQGLSESLAGRFEVLYLPHWTPAEMKAAFGWSVEKSIFYGGYPGSAPLAGDHDRWVRYVRDALIEPTIARDVLLLTRVDKPALLRRLFELGCRYSGQILSYTKMLGQLAEAGNSTTLAHYLDLLGGAGMLTGLPKYSGSEVRQRGSSPKLQVLDTALMSALAGRTFEEARGDRTYWGRLTESAVGAHLANAAASGSCEVFYWRDRNREVDFVVRARRTVTAIEVKSGRPREMPAGLAAFVAELKPQRTLLVGGDGISVEEFLMRPAEHWVAGGS
jgi:predicted AAA+ superfamily ATPase